MPQGGQLITEFQFNDMNPEGDYVVVARRRSLKQQYRWTRYSTNGKKLSGSQESYTNFQWTVAMAARCNKGCIIRDSEGYSLSSGELL